IGIAAVWLFASPLGVWLSILFPVAADLSKTGKGGNPHPLAMLVGLVAVMALLVPTALLFVAAEFWLREPPLVLVLELCWLLVAFPVPWPLLNLASSSLSGRRENLALLR